MTGNIENGIGKGIAGGFTGGLASRQKGGRIVGFRWRRDVGHQLNVADFIAASIPNVASSGGATR